MKPLAFLRNIIDPTLQWLPSVGVLTSAGNEARVLLLTIAGQESGWMYRRQSGGPARGYWQFEGGSMSGTAQVEQHAGVHLKRVCEALDIPCVRETVFEALAWNDQLACSMARLLLWADPKPLPALGNVEGAWNYYVGNWHPGAPHRDVWPDIYEQSLAFVKANPLGDTHA